MADVARRAMRRAPWVGALLLTASIASGETTAADPTADRAAIADAARAFSAAYEADDSHALGELYTEDAMLLSPNRTVVGREAIRRFFDRDGRTTSVQHELCNRSLRLHGDTAVDVGTWYGEQRAANGAGTEVAGRYLVVWLRGADGRWRMTHDAWHRPPPAADHESTMYWRFDRAVHGGDAATVRALLVDGADPNGECDYLEFLPADPVGLEFSAPLVSAVRAGHAGIVEILLAAGARVDVAEGANVTPLAKAAERGDAAMARRLLAAGADPAHRTLFGTPAEMAAKGGHGELARELAAAAARGDGR